MGVGQGQSETEKGERERQNDRLGLVRASETSKPIPIDTPLSTRSHISSFFLKSLPTGNQTFRYMSLGGVILISCKPPQLANLDEGNFVSSPEATRMHSF